MLVLSMNPKRQRRPNVRLGEIGDVPAAFACGISPKTRENYCQKRWKNDFVIPEESEYNHISGFSQQRSSECTLSDPGVSPRRISADMQQNGENKNPNSMKLVSEFSSSDDIDARKSTLNFGTITRKCRLMIRRRRSTRGKRIVLGGPWNSKIGPEFSNEDEKEYGMKEGVGFASSPCFNLYHVNEFNDASDHETLAMSKEAYENHIDATTFNIQTGGNSNQSWKEDACHEGNNVFSESFGRDDRMELGRSDVNSVRRWLEELGFGKYADVFEMHEVDEKALLLLTFEDLKEMGVLAVGPRRKLYTAIQQLRQVRERGSA